MRTTNAAIESISVLSRRWLSCRGLPLWLLPVYIIDTPPMSCPTAEHSLLSYTARLYSIVRGLADRDDLDCLWFALHDFGISACEHWTDVSGERTLTNRHHTRPYSTKEVYEGEVVWKSCYSNSSEWPHRSLDRCIVFARWCQCEPPSNTRFLGPTGVCPLKRYLKFSIGSAVLLYFVAWR